MRKIVWAIAVFTVALLFIAPPIMVLYLEGPVWPAIQFAIIQTLLVLMGLFIARGFKLLP